MRRVTEAEAAALRQAHQQYLLRRLLGVRAAKFLEPARKGQVVLSVIQQHLMHVSHGTLLIETLWQSSSWSLRYQLELNLQTMATHFGAVLGAGGIRWHKAGQI